MTGVPFTAPAFNITAFNCPHCNAYSAQTWQQVFRPGQRGAFAQVDNLVLAFCVHCRTFSLWYHGDMIFPVLSPAPLPSPDLPESIAADYAEARSIVLQSPRGAAALFRLCVQKLCAHLGESGKDLNSDIAALVRRGLNPTIQRSLDIVRVIGNEAVHPGELDLRDDRETAINLASLVNLIVDSIISQPNTINRLYEKLPATKREAIERRDGLTGES